MAHAYTPGLKVTERTVVRKDRRLPLPGDIIVGLGATVKSHDIVARTELPGNVTTVNVAGVLGIPQQDVDHAMLKKTGERVEKNELVAQSKGLFGLFKSQVRSPVTGTIESVSPITGQLILREPPQPVQVNAYIDGSVVEVFKNEGVVVETTASFIQGIFGIGGETWGELMPVVDSPATVLTADKIDDKSKDKILIGGSLVEHTALEKAVAVGAKGVVVGGIEDRTLKQFLGYDLGIAITGSEKRGLTVVVTEGFGTMRMAERTFRLLCALSGQQASMNGATQIRAGVIRPEVIVSCTDTQKISQKEYMVTGLEIGTPVRIIREPNFGLLGKVVSLPVELMTIETESKVRVLEVELEDHRRVVLPRANVEIIES